MHTARPEDPRDGTRPGVRQGGADEGDAAGFTLIELMVVLLIMAILMAIALPTFLGVRVGAQYRSAQSDLTNSVISARSIFAADGRYPTAGTTATELQTAEPEMTYLSGTAPPDNTNYTLRHTISLSTSTTNGYIIVVTEQSPDGRCWYAESNDEPAGVQTTDGFGASYDANPGVWYAGSIDTGLASCNANSVPSLYGSGWSQAYPPAT